VRRIAARHARRARARACHLRSHSEAMRERKGAPGHHADPVERLEQHQCRDLTVTVPSLSCCFFEHTRRSQRPSDLGCATRHRSAAPRGLRPTSVVPSKLEYEPQSLTQRRHVTLARGGGQHARRPTPLRRGVCPAIRLAIPPGAAADDTSNTPPSKNLGFGPRHARRNEPSVPSDVSREYGDPAETTSQP